MKNIMFISMFLLFNSMITHAQTAMEWSEKADNEMKNGNYKNAVFYSNEAIKLDSQLAAAYFVRGYAENALGNYTDAINDLTWLINSNLSPSNESAAFTYCVRGEAKCHLKIYASAIDDFDEAISLDPKLKSAYNYRAAVVKVLNDASSPKLDAQPNKQQTLDYILHVYQEAYISPPIGDDSPQAISCHYQTLIIQYKYHTLTSSLKKGLTYDLYKYKYDQNDPYNRDYDDYWSISTSEGSCLPRIRTEDQCNRLFKALLHLQQLLRDDKDSKDPFDN